MREDHWWRSSRKELMPLYARGSWSQNDSQAQSSNDMIGQLY